MRTNASGSSASRRSSGWMPPHPTATANTPGALRGTDVERRIADVDRLGRRASELSRPRAARGRDPACAGPCPRTRRRRRRRSRAPETAREQGRRSGDAWRSRCRASSLRPSAPAGPRAARRRPRASRAARRCAPCRPRADASACSTSIACICATIPWPPMVIPSSSRRNLSAEHGADRVLHRREDDRPGVDQRAVEVEQDDPEAHTAIVASAQYVDPLEVEAPRRRGESGLGAGTTLEKLTDSIGRRRPRLEHRPDERRAPCGGGSCPP